MKRRLMDIRELTQSELERYDRQLLIPGWGLEGQKRLKNAKVAVVGVGGLGCPASLYLTAVGVGRIRIIDRERFELSNLNRQILGYQTDLGKFKVHVAKEKLKMLNPEVDVEPIVAEVTRDNVHEVVGDVDVVVDGMDNWRTRLVLNEYCVSHGIPFIHTAVSEMYGQITTIVAEKGPCLRCIFPKTPPEAEKTPVLGAAPALLASLQVMEVVKLIIGIGEPLIGRMLFVDGRAMRFEEIRVEKREDCPVCGSKRQE